MAEIDRKRLVSPSSAGVAISYREGGHIGPRGGDVPAFHVSPYVSLWAVRSKKTPDAVGCGIIAGDLPTDYLSAAENAAHPRTALAGLRPQSGKQHGIESP